MKEYSRRPALNPTVFKQSGILRIVVSGSIAAGRRRYKEVRDFVAPASPRAMVAMHRFLAQSRILQEAKL
jgi:hypothetical protein